MDKLDNIAKDLFDKIRGRYKNVTLGNQDSTITNEPGQARFFDVKIADGQNVNLALDEKSLTIMYSEKLFGENQIGKDNWYSFLKELRMFAKKRMLNFDIRDITKSNLDRRDYEYLRKEKFGDNTMSESRLYGTSKKSFQDIGRSKLIITHTESMNHETNRSTKIKSIHIENADGERFKYPYKHLSGARAVARHISEGGNPYDDFGKHVIGLSEELSKLRKFKTYINRSAVMAEGLGSYVNVVNQRVDTIKTTINKLQKESFYREYYETFSPSDDVIVPEDIQGDWIEQLTVKQFNEELKDVFPFIYRLVSEQSKPKDLSLEELADATKGDNMNPDFDKLFDESLGNFAEHKTKEKNDFIGYMIENVKTLDQLNQLDENQLWTGYLSTLNESDVGRAKLNESFIKGIVKGVGKTIKSLRGGAAKSADDSIAPGMKGAPTQAQQADALADINKIATDAAKKKADEVAPGLGKTVDSAVEVPSDSFIKNAGKGSGGGKPPGGGTSAAASGADDAAGAAAKGADDAADAGGGVMSTLGKAGKVAGVTAQAGTLPTAVYLQQDMKKSVEDNMAGIQDNIKGLENSIVTKSEEIANQVTGQVDRVAGQAQGALDSAVDQVTGGGGVAGAVGGAVEKGKEMVGNAVQAVTQSDAAQKIKDALPNLGDSTIGQIAKIAAQNWLPLGLVFLTLLGGLRVIKWFFGLLFDDVDYQPGNSHLQESDVKVPVTEFILSYFDRETGSFPKGETAVLTMVEKDYGDRYVPVAEKFIEAVQSKFYEMNTSSNELQRIRELALK